VTLLRMQRTLNHTDQHHGCVIVFVTDMSNVAYTVFDPKCGSQIKIFFYDMLARLRQINEEI